MALPKIPRRLNTTPDLFRIGQLVFSLTSAMHNHVLINLELK